VRIYIASPYTLGDPVLNVRKSLATADALLRMGHTPFVPLLSHFWHFYSPKPYSAWLEMDLEWVTVCDALLRLPGESAGADREVEQAAACGLPVYYALDQVPQVPRMPPETPAEPHESTGCALCGTQDRPFSFLDLAELHFPLQSLTICHDCADQLVDLLLDRFYALWGHARWYADGSGPAEHGRQRATP